jgi:DeoR family fructose operon transcriptional repressor
MMESARKVVAMVDHSKFGNVQLFSFADFDEVDVLVTDTGVEPDAVEVLTGHGMSVRRG